MSYLQLLQPPAKRGETVSVQQVFTFATALVAIAAVCWLGWSWLAMPAGGGERLADLDRAAAAMEQAAGARGRTIAYPAGAVCSSLVDGAAGFEQRLSAAAAASGLALDDLTVTPGAPNQTSGLTPVSATFGVTGPYDAILAFLDGLARSQPTVFVSQADLKPKTSVVTLNFTGRILCWTNARQ